MNYSDDSFIDQVTEMMPRLLRALMEHEHADLASEILTFPQYNVLLCLYNGDPSSMHAVADQLKLTPSNLTGIMNRLVDANMVERYNSDDDRRLVMARITADGKALMDRIMRAKRQTLRHIYASLSPEDQKNYVRIMQRILHALETFPATQVPAEKP